VLDPDSDHESDSDPESELESELVESDGHDPPPGREPAVPEGLLGTADEAPGLPIT
jgi:hypothetical protein